MAVYVDDMYTMPMGQYGRMKMSHMIADTEAELHVMAEAIGIARRWFQKKPSGDHYDVAMSKRRLAVERGARQITVRQCVAICYCRSNGLSYDSPEQAYGLYKAHIQSIAHTTNKSTG